MNSNDPAYAPLRDVTRNPEAFAQYLDEIERVVLDIGKNLETLQHETRVYCRNTHVEGDRWYHARMRARPLEKALKDVLKHVGALADGLEKSTYKRRAHDDEVKALPRKRKDKALAKQRKRNSALRPAPENPGTGNTEQNQGYSGPASIYDLGKERSA